LLAGILPEAVAARPRCHGKRATMVGTARADRLTGTSGRDVIVARAGDDRINGRGGADLICGGPGDDRIRGAAGADGLAGGRGDNDVISGGPNDDRIGGGPGTADVADYSEALSGVEANLPAEIARGEGEDQVVGIEDVTGSEFDDALYGNEHSNSLLGFAGNDTLLGNQGPDFLQPAEGDDTVNGGGESDVVDYFFTEVEGPLAIDLTAGTASGQGNDTLISVEAAGGGPFDDVIIGDNEPNGSFGFEGNDSLHGGPGAADVLQGGPGDDVVDGGEGDHDTADYLGVPVPVDPVVVDLSTGTATRQGSDSLVEIEKVNGTDENDTLTGDDLSNTLFGFEGDDFIYGLAGDDFLAGREGFDTLDGGDGSDDCVDGEANSDCEFEYRRSGLHRVTTLRWSGAQDVSWGADRRVWTYSLHTRR
jgi:Ca2+-binding RTX toxin-like protein